MIGVLEFLEDAYFTSPRPSPKMRLKEADSRRGMTEFET
jgi:hypothetical protein